MSFGRLLWQYARRYVVWMVLALVSIVFSAASPVMLLALLRPIFSEVLLVEEQDMPDVLQKSAPASQSGKGGGGWLENLGQKLDLTDWIDRGFERLRAALAIDDHEIVVFLPALFVLVFLVRSLSDFLGSFFFQVIGLGVTTDLRNGLYERILHQSSRFLGRHSSGELVSRVGYDVSVLQHAVSNRLLDLLLQSVTLLGLTWYLLSLNRRLAVICLVIVPAIFYPIVRFGKSMRKTSQRSQERLADVSNLVAEAVRGYRVVKAFGMEAFELARFREATRRHLRVNLKAQRIASGSGPVVETLAATGGAAFLVYAGFAIRSGKLAPSVLLTFLIGLVMLYDPIRKLNKVNLVLQEALAAGGRIAGLMAVENEIVDRPGAIALSGFEREIRFEKVSFAYDDDVVISEVDLTVRRGEVVALVGASGAGKSTLVNLLLRFFDPDGGRVSIDGHDLREVTLHSLRGLLGLVTQDTILFNDTVRNNIAYGRSDLPLAEVEAAARAAYADGFIAELPEGYETVIGEAGFKLSGGQRQRLAIARALLKNPPILVLDEATSHLDSESESLVQKALSTLMSGRTALVIAHRLSTIKRADRIVVMDRGQVAEVGSHEELLARGGFYQRLYELQFRET